MPEIVIDIKANTSQLSSLIDTFEKLQLVEKGTMDSIRSTHTKYLETLADGANKAKKSVDELNTKFEEVGKGAAANLANTLDVSAPVAKAAQSVATMKQRYREAQQEAQRLAETIGNDLDPRVLAATKKAGKLKDEMDDMNRRIKLMTPEGKFQAMGNVIQGAAGAMHVLTGSLQLFGIENKKAQEVAQQFQGALNIAAGLAQFAQMKEYVSDLAATFGLVTTAEKAATGAASGLKTALITTGVGALVVALGYLVTELMSTDDAAKGADEAIKGASSTSKEAAGNILEYSKTIGEAARRQRIAAIDEKLARGEISKAKADQLKLDIENEKIRSEASIKEIDRTKREGDAKKAYYAAMTALAVANASGTADEQAKARTTLLVTKKAYNDILKEKVTADQVANAQIAANNAEHNAKIVQQNQDAAAKASEEAKKALEEDLAARKAFNEEVTKDLEAGLTGVAKIKSDYGKKQAELDEKYFGIKAPTEAEYAAWLKATEEITKEKQDAIKKQQEEVNKARLETIKKASIEELNLDKKNTKEINELNLQNDLNAAKLQYEKRGDFSDKAQKDLQKQLADITNKAQSQQLENDYQFAVTEAGILYGVDSPQYKEAVAAADRAKKLGLGKLLSGATDTGNKEAEETAAKRKKNIDAIHDAEIKAVADTAQAYVDAWAEAETKRLEMSMASVDDEKKANDDALKHRLITKEEHDAKSAELDEKKAKKERELRVKQAQIEKEKALFGIFLKTAEALIAAWLEPATAPLSTSTVLTIAGIETAAVLARPIPKFKRGTLSVPGTGTEDSVHALLQPGEAVIPTEINKKYHSAVKAIYRGSISPKDLNDFVNSQGKNSGSGISTSDLYLLTKAINKNSRVNIGNFDELASHIASMNNPRR